MTTARSRPRSRQAERRLGVERVIWRFRSLVAVVSVAQTILAPGDHVALNLAAVGGLTVSALAAGPFLQGSPSDRTVRRVSVSSMVLDSLVIAALLANNLTDPAEPIYLVVLLGIFEAAGRWSLRGGLIGGVLGGIATAGWLVAVYLSVGEPVQVSYTTMSAATMAGVGTFVGFVVARLSNERRVLQHTLDVSRDLIVTTDERGRMLSANRASIALLGFAPEELVGHEYRDFLHPEDVAPADRAFSELLSSHEPAGGLINGRFECADGSYRWLELNANVTDDHLIYVVARDVTERREVARRLEVSEQRFRSLFDHSADAVYSFDLDGRLTSANPATEQLTGYPWEELSGMNIVGLIEPEERGETLRAFGQAARGRARTYDMTLRSRAGTRVDLHVTNLPIVVDDAVVGVYGVAKDVTDRRSLERELAYQARHDDLTGLPNRLALEELLAGADGGEDDTVSALLFIDLDGFKLVNDSLGHRAGDGLLRAVGGRLGGQLRDGDILVRWAGDEFCAVLSGVAASASAAATGQRLLDALEVPFEHAGREVRISASIGVAVGDRTTDADALLRWADLAMYEAKRRGGSRVRIYETSLDGGPRRLDLEAELRRALGEGGLALAYQPIVVTGTGAVVGFEALARWPRPGAAPVGPATFIPLAEETGLIRELTRWVLAEACGQLAAWDTSAGPGRTPLTIGVNVSAADVADPRLVNEVADTLAASRLAPGRLVLEVTESMLVQEGALPVLDELHHLGVHLVIDDFGSGYSSLCQVQHLPVSCFKLDRAFIEDLGPGSKSSSMVASLVGLGEALELPVVAEGVERPEQHAELEASGCPMAQGYLFAPPAPAESIWPLVQSRRVEPARSASVAGAWDRRSLGASSAVFR